MAGCSLAMRSPQATWMPRRLARALPAVEARTFRFAQPGGINAAGRGGKQQRPKSPGLAQGILEGGPAAHRLRHDGDLRQAQMLDQGGKIVGKVGGVGTARNHGGWLKSAVRKGHAGVVRRQGRDLLPPGRMVAAEAVRKNDRLTAAAHLVVKLASGPRQAALAPLRHGVGLAHGRLLAAAAARVAVRHPSVALKPWPKTSKPTLPCW